MNALLTAILDQKVGRVRELAAIQPELLSECSASGSLPFDVADSCGYVQISVALLRQSAPGSERISDFGRLLVEYLKHLSHTFTCAGWLSNIEFVIWSFVVGDKLPIEDTFGFQRITRDELADLRFLSEKCQSWPCWDEHEQRVRTVSLTRWQHLYREWYEGQSRRGMA